MEVQVNSNLKGMLDVELASWLEFLVTDKTLETKIA